LTAIADRMHALLVIRANAVEGCTEGLPEEAELAELVAVIEPYEVIRWPLGRTQDGKASSSHLRSNRCYIL
jgi:hypothetical protein